jgi:hypothetical protein
VRAGLPDAESWWAEPGRAGWLPGDALGTAFPPAYAGLVIGGWRLDDLDRAPAALPWPGVRQARGALTGYDSLAAGEGDGAWDGFGGALAELRARPAPLTRRALSTFCLTNGSSGLDQNALTVARGDTTGGLGVNMMSGTRGAVAGFERSARHVWEGRVGRTWGARRLDASFAQRGGAATLAGGEQLDARGQSGSLGWSWRRGDLRSRLAATRGLDRHRGFGGSLSFSERVAQETRTSLTVGRARGARDLEARLEWSDAEVRRTGAAAASRTARALWGAGRVTTTAGPGRLVVGLGAGRHAGVDRIEIAPSARYETRLGAARAALALERVLTPVWADLAPGRAAFLQRASVASVRLALGDSGAAWRLRGTARAGRVQDRALAARLPLEELWLRRGIDCDPATYDFVLGEAGVEWRRGRLGAGLEGFGLGQRESGAPAGATLPLLSDPRGGFRAWLSAGRTLFGGDLDVTVRGEAEGVGRRQAAGAGGAVRELPPFASLGGAVELGIGDVVMVLRLRDLLDRVRSESWVDSATGLPVVSGQREIRFDLVWRLFN